MDLKTWVNEWLHKYKRVLVKPSTFDSYVHYAKHVTCRKELSEVTCMDVQEMITDMVVDGCKLSTVKHMLTVLRQSLRKAKALGMINNLSMLEELELPSFDGEKVEPLRAYEVEALLARCSYSFYGEFFKALLYTGCRVGELIALRWCDVNLIGRELRIRNTDYGGKLQPVKTNNGKRTIPLYGELIKIFKDLSKTRPPIGARVFTNTLGLPIAYRSVLDAWQRLLDRIGLRRRGLHVLRHTFAYKALRSEVPVKVVSRWLGHADVYITLQIYDDVFLDDLVDASEKLADSFGEGDRRARQKNNAPSGALTDKFWGL